MSQWLEQVIDGAALDDYLAPVRQQALTQLKKRWLAETPQRKLDQYATYAR